MFKFVRSWGFFTFLYFMVMLVLNNLVFPELNMPANIVVTVAFVSLMLFLDRKLGLFDNKEE
ncbi:MAG: hypothetical protein FWD96_01930 [Defluviitaleaceae bacterium]|nr:hypothetical protein [Defluviitaleaceae bacterium]